MSANVQVGVIGIGAMGMGMARSLRRNGYTTYVRDIRVEAHEEALKIGAQPCSSASTLVAQCDLVFTVVVDQAQTENVLFGSDSVIHGARPGTVIVVSSTLSPIYVASLAPRLAAVGLHLIDAPISGGPKRASEGTMTMMIAGPKPEVARCKPVFSHLAARVFEISSTPGDAAKMKLVNNMLAGANLVAGAEALAMGTKAGLEPQLIYDVVCASSGGSWIFADRMKRIIEGDSTVTAATPILTKDMGLAMEFARSLRFPATLGGAAHSALLAALALGYDKADDGSVYRVYERYLEPQ